MGSPTLLHRMPSLTRTPSGLWTTRKVIPADVRALYGKREEKPTWPAEWSQSQARVAYGEFLADVEARIERLRRRATGAAVSLTRREVIALAGRWYEQQKVAFEADPGTVEGWEAVLEKLTPDLSERQAALLPDGPYEGPWVRQAVLEEDLERLLSEEGLNLTAASREAVLDEMHDLYRALALLLIRRAAGDYGPDRLTASLPEWRPGVAPQASQAPLDDLFASYVAEAKPALSTVKSWRVAIGHLKGFLGHSDAGRITREDMIRWKDHLLSEVGPAGEVRSATTVSFKYLAAVRTVLQWAVENRRLPSNPVAGVRVRVPKKVVLRDRNLSDDEAQLILEGTLQPPPKQLAPEHALARRWVPWLCAYSGARVNEITQLRAQDVFEENGIWVMLITPEAGSTKTSRARRVPLHPHLVDQGFVIVATQATEGPLFYNTARTRGGSGENPPSKKVGERLAAWVRQLGVTDPGVMPNHGWRHRFKTLCRDVGIPADARDFIQGHVSRTEGEEYGSWTARALLREIEKLPRYRVAGDPSSSPR